jgi:small-conductance mechanosensitive channel
LAIILFGVDITLWIELVLAIIATVLVGYLASRAIVHILKVTGTPLEIAKRSGRITKYTLYIVGSILIIVYFALDVIGALVGLGVFGVAIGIGLGTVLSNVVSGAFVILSKTFKVGDEIRVAFFEGKVVKMTIQRVVVETKDGETIFVPTGYFLSNPVARKCADPKPTECAT